MAKDYVLVNGTLYHHGILGMKWGIRRFQNKDGSYTAEGKARRREGTFGTTFNKPSKESVKKATKVALNLVGLAAFSMYVSKHPETIANVIAKSKNIATKALSKETISRGKEIAKMAIKAGAKQVAKGAIEGIKDAPYKVTKAAAGGAAILVANKLVEEMIGKEQNAKYKQAYNAYNKKNKIGQLPGSNKDDEDE